MSSYSEAKQKVVKELKTALGKGYSPTVAELEVPPESALGNFAYPCFALAKGLKKNPAEIARELAAKIEPKGWIKKAEAKGPYVNFFLSETFGQAILENIKIQGEEYGATKDGNGRRIMVEYANPNTHKEIHVGHLRNFFVGQAAVNFLRAVGYEVIPASYINDLGTHVAKCVWALEKFHTADAIPPKEARIAFLGQVYSEATKAEETDPKAKEEISRIYHELESGRGPHLALWRQTRRWSVDDLKKIFKELGLPISVWYFESELIRATKKIIKDLIKKGLAVNSQGAIVVDLSEEKLGVNLLVKSDGTLLYNAKDLPLVFRKEEEYHPEKSIYVVDTRQALAMQQLFATVKRLGFKSELIHLAYDFITLKDGAMSSRKGNIIRYETFREAMIASIRQETKKRHPEWRDKKVEAAARAIAFAAMRFGILRQNPDKKIVFDMEEAMSFDGYTGPYLLYTYARTSSLLKKAGRLSNQTKTNKLVLPLELQLLFQLARYPEIVSSTAQDFKFDRLAEYLFNLAKIFALFYHEVPVLQAKDEETKEARLALTEAVRQVLRNGLKLFGIETVEEM